MDIAIWIIRIGLAVTMIVYGIHQLWKPEYWYKYLPYWLNAVSPIPKKVEIISHGIGNLFLGIWFLSGIFPVASAIINLIWWLTILPTVWKVEWESFFRDITIICLIVSYIVIITIG